MIKNDRQMGTPFIDYRDTKANIEAIQGLVGGETAYSTEGQWGYYNFITGAWVWVTNAGGGGISNHNDLSGLQGGTSGEYYHLSNSQHTQLFSGSYPHFVTLNNSPQTIIGVKTFSSDPIIPDEAYDATAWNGSLEPPTKNAVRDKIETMLVGWELISDQVAGVGGVASFDFTSIAGTYKQLKILTSARSNRAASESDKINLKINNDTGSSYITRVQYTGGSEEQNTAGGVYHISYLSAASSPANWFSNFEITFFDYANTTTYKNWQSRGMQALNTGASKLYIYDAMGLWLSTSAITRITLLPNIGTLFTEYSKATLYGLK